MIAVKPAETNPSFWPVVWKLLRLRLRIFVNGFLRAKIRRKIGTAVLGLLLLGLLGFAFYISWWLLQGLRSPMVAEIVGDMSQLLHTIPTIIFNGAFRGDSNHQLWRVITSALSGGGHGFFARRSDTHPGSLLY